MITAGIDIGSSAIKVVFVNDGEMVWRESRPSTSFNQGACDQLLKGGLDALSIAMDDIAAIGSSGYGKSTLKIQSKKVNEISANAAGAHRASGGRARTIINIGGQDIKIIKVTADGRVVDFKLNDKCAAGTGRFFEMSERILGIPLSSFGDLGVGGVDPASISSTCAVFAETELISLINGGRGVADIVAGIHLSIASRIGVLTAALDLEDEIYFDGGPALNCGLHQAIADELQADIKVLAEPQFTVAYGAAIMAGGF